MFDMVLSAYSGDILFVEAILNLCQQTWICTLWLNLLFPIEMRNELSKRLNWIDDYALREGCLSRTGRRHKNFPNLLLLSIGHHRQDTGAMAHVSIREKLSQKKKTGLLYGSIDLTRSEQDANGDRQIIRWH